MSEDLGRLSLYKNSGKDVAECRRKREIENLSLRRNKREEQIEKRRQLEAEASFDSSQDDGMGVELEQDFSKILENINSPSSELQMSGVKALRHLLCKENDPPIRLVVDSGIIPRLVQLLATNEGAAFQFETAWVLTNVAGGASQDTEAVVSAGAIPVFVKLLFSSSSDVQDQAVWALGNIAGDSPRLRDAVGSCDIVSRLIHIIHQFKQSKPALARNAVWCFSNLCRGRNPPPDYSKLLVGIQTLGGLLQEMTDPDVLADACWALAYIADGPNDNIQAIVNSGCVPHVVALLMHSHSRTVTAALRAVGSIVSGDDKQTQTVLDCHALPCLKQLLGSGSQVIVKETCWTLSNITAGTKNQIQQTLDHGIIPSVVMAMRNGESKTRRECTWLLSNAIIGGNLEQAAYIGREGGLESLCEMLAVLDLRVVENSLSAIERVLRAGCKAKSMNTKALQNQNGQISNIFAHNLEEIGALDKIENFTNHENEKIRKKACQIIERYFPSSRMLSTF